MFSKKNLPWLLLAGGAAYFLWWKPEQEKKAVTAAVTSAGAAAESVIDDLGGFGKIEPQGQEAAQLPQGVQIMREPQGGGGVIRSPQGNHVFGVAPQGRVPKGGPQASLQASRVLGLPSGIGG